MMFADFVVAVFVVLIAVYFGATLPKYFLLLEKFPETDEFRKICRFYYGVDWLTSIAFKFDADDIYSFKQKVIAYRKMKKLENKSRRENDG